MESLFKFPTNQLYKLPNTPKMCCRTTWNCGIKNITSL